MKFLNTVWVRLYLIYQIIGQRCQAFVHPIFNQVSDSTDKLMSASYENIIVDWVKLKYPQKNLVVLLNVNVSVKNIYFWAKMPKKDAVHFLGDVVILMCKDKPEVFRLIENMGSDFADAYGFSSGEQITSNKELV